jgi:hypothetical protein
VAVAAVSANAAVDPEEPIAITDAEGSYRSDFIPLEGEYRIEVRAVKEGITFEEEVCSWTNTFGYEEHQCNFDEYDDVTVTPTFTPTPTVTSTPTPTATFTPTPTPTVTSTPDIIPPNFRVAFLANLDAVTSTHDVLRLVRDEGTDMVIIAGDILFHPDIFEPTLKQYFSNDVPVFAVVGDRNMANWAEFQTIINRHNFNVPGVACTGDFGVNSSCTYKGFNVLLSGVGTAGSGHEAYLRQELTGNQSLWPICVWHKHMSKMQLGAELDETGWGVYEACREGGAMVATGQENSYGRTYLMASFAEQFIQNRSPVMVIREGQSFAFHNGLGGFGVVHNQYQEWPWFAAAYTAQQNGNFGALFCTYNDNGQQNHASCTFKDIDGVVPDQFELISDRDYTPVSSFEDVSTTHWAFPHIQKLYDLGYIAGCSESPLRYCLNDMIRAEMAVYIDRAIEGGSYIPTIDPTPVPPFEDVTEPSDYFFKWVDDIKDKGLTKGCDVEGTLFCPYRTQTMAEYSVYITRVIEGDPNFIPPQPTADALAQIADLNGEHFGAKWIHYLWQKGIYPKCQGPEPGLYLCPDGVVNRGMAAYMLVLSKEISTE